MSLVPVAPMALELPTDLVERAAAELNETPESRAAGLQALQQYYDAHYDERPHRTDAPYLLMFLRHAKMDPTRARGRIAAVERWLLDCRQEIGDISALRGEMFTGLYGQNFLGVLGPERRTRDGAVISLLLPRNMEPLADPSIILKWNVWMLGRAIHNPYMQVCGQVVLESFVDISLMNSMRFRQVPSAIVRKNFKFALECMPFRMRGIWLVQQPKWIGFLFALAKPFLSAKLRSRVRMFGSDFKALHELIDPQVLPVEFGGSHADTGAAWFAKQLAMEAEEQEARQGRHAAEGASAAPN